MKRALSPNVAAGQPFVSAFLGATYGQPWQRFWLTPSPPSAAPAWAEAVRSWVIVTAWNPWGQFRDEAENLAAHDQLRLRIARSGYSPLLGHNGEGQWRETALIVPGATLRDAIRWGQEFRQAAVVFGVGRRASLVWLTPAHVKAERHWLAPAPLDGVSGGASPDTDSA